MKKKGIIRILVMMLLDVALLFLATYFADFIVFNRLEVVFSKSPTEYAITFAVNAILLLAMFFALKIYNVLLKYVGLFEVLKITMTFGLLLVMDLVLMILMPIIDIRIVFCSLLFAYCAILVSRFVYRMFVFLWQKTGSNHEGAKGERLIIVGAGDAGVSVLREIYAAKSLSIHPIGFVDDDVSKQNTFVAGLKVLGRVRDIERLCEKYEVQNIYIAMPSVDKLRVKAILEECSRTKANVKILPGMYQIMEGSVLLGQMRKVEVSDLLGREQIRVNLDEILGYIENKRVLVTGGGGSIGSELCRQIACHNPSQLIIFDIYENNAYEIEQELRRKLPKLNMVAVIGSIRDMGKLEDLFKEYSPEIVFNCAAHKHVPLMEVSPNEAIKNNVYGTYNLAKCADKFGTKRFVQISTDKAVNPTNVMGASKRICEMIIQTMAKNSKTEFVAVRFGNVLGSNGSVIPLFKRQIEEGGPVTVTHKDIIRYFMTIPEAVSLVLQAGAYAKGGEIYVLDMGEPVRIYDLAYNLIKLSGYEPNVDIQIKCTGLRPGEKLYEERLMDEEGLQTTANGMISVAKPIEFDEEKFTAQLDSLIKASFAESDDIRSLIAGIVPTYKPKN